MVKHAGYVQARFTSYLYRNGSAEETFAREGQGASPMTRSISVTSDVDTAKEGIYCTQHRCL